MSYVLPLRKKNKFLSPKLDTFQKHANHCKVVVVISNVVVGDWYYNKYVPHKKKTDLYGRSKESILNLVQYRAHASSIFFLIQFVNIFHVLSHG